MKWFIHGYDPDDPDRRCTSCGERTTSPGCTEDSRHPQMLWHTVEDA